MSAVAINLRNSGIAWVGKVPSHWVPMRLKDTVEGCVNGIWGDDPTDEGFDTPVIRVADFNRNGRSTNEHQTVRFIQQNQKESRVLELGDLLIEKSGGGELQPVGMVVEYQGPDNAVCSNFVARMRPREFMNGRFLTYLHAHLYERSITTLSIKQSTGIQNLDSAAYLAEKCFIPPLDEQIAIAAYLDAETKRIDWLINEKENLLKLLIELRGGIIRELTAGIHLRSAMQETGNVFMPVIPSDWDMSGIGRFSSLGNGSTPLKDNADYWNGGTYPWLNSSVVNQDEVTEGSELVTKSALKQCHLPIVPSGSVLVALTGQGKTRGQATMLRIEATINQHLAYIQTDGERLDGEYLFWVLSGQFNALRMISDGQGGTKGALTCDDLRKFQIPLPPLETQKKIASRLYEDTRRVDELVVYAKKEIEVLAELRSSTITDAVLGRIDVRKSQTH